MFATIRRYTATTTSPEDIEESRLYQRWIPSDGEGHRGIPRLSCLRHGQGTLYGQRLRDASGRSESTRRAAEFVRKTPLPLQVGPAEVIEGELLISLEVAGAH